MKIDNNQIDLKFIEVNYVSMVNKDISYLQQNKQLRFERDKVSESKIKKKKSKKQKEELRKMNSIIRIYDADGMEVNIITNISQANWNKVWP